MNYTQTAHEYVRNGFNVLPLQLDGTKKSVGRWGHLQERIATEHELHEWFGTGQCGIGVLTGPISNNLHLLDFDNEAAELFKRFWDEVQQRLPGILEKILVVRTPRPGFQVWFRQTSVPPKSQQLALSEPKPTGETDADGNPILLPEVLVETRGTGAYACAVGTAPATHPNGTPYQLVHGSFASLPQLTDAEAETMLAICRGYTRCPLQHVQKQPGEKYAGEPRPGDIYNQQADIRQLLIEAGWQVHHQADDAEYMTRPGKNTADGYSATLGYVRGDDEKPLLMVFTSAIPPFEKGCCYDAFGVYAMTKHKGDYGKAAAQIRIEYAAQVQAEQMQFHAEVQQRFQATHGADLNYTPFPLETLDAVTAAYVQEHAAAIDIDPAYIGCPLLSVLAGLIGPARQIQLKTSWREPSILWTVTIGKPSSGKSPGWEIAIAPAEHVQRSLHLINQQAKELDPEAKAPPRQLLVDDITMESLARVHLHNDRLILTTEELAGWINSMDAYRGGKGRDSQQWLRMYGSGSLKVNRATNDLYLFVPRTAVSVTGTIQPAVAAETLFSEKSRSSGFAYRILAVQPPGYVMGWSDREPPASCVNDMIGLAQRLFALEQEPCGDGYRPLALPCSDSAQRVFRQFVGTTKDIATAASDDGESRWVKLRAIAARFALVLAVVKQVLHRPDGPAMQPIDAESMQAGIQLAMWFGHEMERNWLSVSGGDAELLEHYSWVCAKHPNRDRSIPSRSDKAKAVGGSEATGRSDRQSSTSRRDLQASEEGRASAYRFGIAFDQQDQADRDLRKDRRRSRSIAAENRQTTEDDDFGEVLESVRGAIDILIALGKARSCRQAFAILRGTQCRSHSPSLYRFGEDRANKLSISKHSTATAKRRLPRNGYPFC